MRAKETQTVWIKKRAKADLHDKRHTNRRNKTTWIFKNNKKIHYHGSLKTDLATQPHLFVQFIIYELIYWFDCCVAAFAAEISLRKKNAKKTRHAKYFYFSNGFLCILLFPWITKCHTQTNRNFYYFLFYLFVNIRPRAHFFLCEEKKNMKKQKKQTYRLYKVQRERDGEKCRVFIDLILFIWFYRLWALIFVLCICVFSLSYYCCSWCVCIRFAHYFQFSSLCDRILFWFIWRHRAWKSISMKEGDNDRKSDSHTRATMWQSAIFCFF